MNAISLGARLLTLLPLNGKSPPQARNLAQVGPPLYL